MSLNFWTRRLRSDRSHRGQVLIVFAVAFAVIIMMLALLFDAARATVLRRQLQDASDSAAMAAANTFQGLATKGCSATVGGGNPGSPQAQVITAARNSVLANLPGFDVSNVQVTCVGAENNVQVTLNSVSPSYFGSIFGGGSLSTQARSVAENGYQVSNQFNVVLLDPSNYGWPNGRQGCPSFGVNGGIVAQFDSAFYIDSACDVAHGGAFAPNGGSASISFTSGAMHIVGEYDPGSLTVTPAPIEHEGSYPDKLKDKLVPPLVTGPTVSASKLTINGAQTSGQCTAKGLLGGANSGCVARPGVYTGGIELKSSAVLYLLPGIYWLKDGGLQLGAQSKLFTISSGQTGADTSNWSTNCVATSCGVLIYKSTSSTSTSSPMYDPISIQAGATFMVRSYNPDADIASTYPTTVTPSSYDREPLRHLLIWQDRLPIPSPTYIQPTIQLQGGGNVTMAGAIYAPSAPVDLHGTSGGSGGSSVDLTIQFIVWDLSLSGNSSFHFQYSASEFPQNLDYGLVQ
jgi:Putative Flp pilus-assembly TadE/G-like